MAAKDVTLSQPSTQALIFNFVKEHIGAERQFRSEAWAKTLSDRITNFAHNALEKIKQVRDEGRETDLNDLVTFKEGRGLLKEVFQQELGLTLRFFVKRQREQETPFSFPGLTGARRETYERDAFLAALMGGTQTQPSSRNTSHQSLVDNLFGDIFKGKTLESVQVKVTWGEKNPIVYPQPKQPDLRHYMFDPVKQLQALWQAAVENRETDVSFTFGNQQLLAHQSILRIKSEAFRTAFAETKGAPIQVPIYDYTQKGFMYFLKFLYLGELKDTNDIALLTELLEIAKAYQSEDLKLWCFDQLTNSLNDPAFTRENFGILFQLGLQHAQIAQLSERCLQFAENDPQGILMIQVLGTYLKNPQLVRDYIQRFKGQLPKLSAAYP